MRARVRRFERIRLARHLRAPPGPLLFFLLLLLTGNSAVSAAEEARVTGPRPSRSSSEQGSPSTSSVPAPPPQSPVSAPVPLETERGGDVGAERFPGQDPLDGHTISDTPPNLMPWLTPSFAQTLTLQYGYVWHALQSSVSGLQVTVHYLPGDEIWAQTTLQDAHQALPILERLTGVPFMFGHDIQLWALREQEFPLAGLNIQERGILLSRSQNAVVHELAHYWVGSHLLSEQWMAEGLAELYAFLVENQVEGRAWRPLDMERLHVDPSLDGPLALWQGLNPLQLNEQPADTDRFFYNKAFLFWYALYRVQGPGLIRDLHRWLKSLRAPAGTAELLAFVQQRAAGAERTQFPSIWDIFPGWLVAGEYRLSGRNQSFEWYLEDDDDDGVLNLEERLVGLNPSSADSDGDGLPDGWELYEGRNANQAEGGGRYQHSVWVLPQFSPSSSHRYVKKGELVHVRAEGLWRVGGAGQPWTGPEGIPLTSFERATLEAQPGERLMDPSLVVPGELVAQIGWGAQGGKIHRIGRSGSFVADRNGILYFAAQGPELVPGRGNLIVSVMGGQTLPTLDRSSRVLSNRAARLALLRTVRESNLTQLELMGRHVTLSLHPTDLESMSHPETVLAWLDRMYELYRDMLPEAPYQGRRILISFDVLSREELKCATGGLVLTFGLEHLYALPDATGPTRQSWPFAVGMALPFLNWYQADTLVKAPGVMHLAEVMAARLYRQSNADLPIAGQINELLRSGKLRLEAQTAAQNPLLFQAFLFSLEERFGWAPFRSLLVENGSRGGRRRGTAPESRASATSVEPFLERFSQATGQNLVDYYTAWGQPVSARLQESLATLPRINP